MLNKDKNSKRRVSFIKNNKEIKIEENKEKNPPLKRGHAKDSSVRSNTTIIKNKNFFNKRINNIKPPEKLNLKVNFKNNISMEPKIKHSQSPKSLNIPIINFQRINERRKTNEKNLSKIEEKQVSNFANILSCKQNNILNINTNDEGINSKKTINSYNYKSQTNNNQYLKKHGHTSRNHNINPFIIQTSSNVSNNSNFSDEMYSDLKSSKEVNNNNISLKSKSRKDYSPKYPYTSRNEFINFAFNRFTKRNTKNSETYIKNYLTKVEGYDNEKIEEFFNNILDKNIKDNIKEIEKQFLDRGIYSKTKRLYLSSHLIQRIKPILNSMGERDKLIYKLEKNLTNATMNK